MPLNQSTNVIQEMESDFNENRCGILGNDKMNKMKKLLMHLTIVCSQSVSLIQKSTIQE